MMPSVSAQGTRTRPSPHVSQRLIFSLPSLLRIRAQLSQKENFDLKHPSFFFGSLFCNPSLLFLLPNDDLQRE